MKKNSVILNEVKKLPVFFVMLSESETTAQTIVLHFSRSFASLRMTKGGAHDDSKKAYQF